MPAIDSWLRSESNSVSRSVSVETRSSNSGAVLSRLVSAPGRVGMTGTP